MLAGVDVHPDSLDVVRDVVEKAGFSCDFELCGMEKDRSAGTVGLINPPFSIHLESPTLEPFDCTTWGKFGNNTSAISQTCAGAGT